MADRRIRASLVAVAADSLLIGLKVVLATVTGSTALWADALHSGTDLLVSLVLLISLVIRYLQERRQATTGIHRAHRFESILALLVAVSILFVPYEIIGELRKPSDQPVGQIWIGIIGVLFSIVIAYFMAQLKTSVGRDTQSPALEADGYHSHMDVLSSIAVLLSFVGLLMGLYLDNLVAVLIAVFVGLAGIELLVSGLRSLVSGTELVQVSISEYVLFSLQRSSLGNRVVSVVSGIRRTLTAVPLWLYVLLLLMVYGLSGLSQVSLGQKGIKFAFGQVIAEPLSPGLHYHLPWPMGRITLVSQQRVHRLLIGTPLQVEQSGSPLLWQQWRESTDEPLDIGEHFITADEALINMTIAMQYQLPDWAQQWQSVKQVDDMIAAYASNALSEEVARYHFADLLNDFPQAFLPAVNQHIQQSLATIGIDIRILNTRLVKVQPPSQTVTLYRDVFAAQQESVRLKLLAEAENFQQVHTASAEKIRLASEAQASRLEQQITASGNARRFTQMAEVYRLFPQLVEFNRYLEHLLVSLSDRKLTVIDQAFDERDLRIWGGSKNNTPVPDIRLK